MFQYNRRILIFLIDFSSSHAFLITFSTIGFMNIDGINIRTTLKPGDIGYVIYLHGYLYSKEYNYGLSFENYVASGLSDFYNYYDANKDRVWVCEYEDNIIGFILAAHRDNNAIQLRYFILLPEYRGIGLGTKLMQLFIDFLQEKKCKSAYLWTTHEQVAAASLYKKYGFVLTEEKESSAFGKPLIEQRYDLLLAQ